MLRIKRKRARHARAGPPADRSDRAGHAAAAARGGGQADRLPRAPGASRRRQGVCRASATCCTAAASPAPPCCSASTGRATGAAHGRRSSGATPTCRPRSSPSAPARRSPRCCRSSERSCATRCSRSSACAYASATGRCSRPPHELPAADERGLGIWQKLMVFTSQGATHAGHSIAPEIVRRLRASGAAGATTLPRHLGLPRRPPPARRPLPSAPASCPRGHDHRRHARANRPLVRDHRRAHERARPRDERDGPRLQRDERHAADRRPAARGPGLLGFGGEPYRRGTSRAPQPFMAAPVICALGPPPVLAARVSARVDSGRMYERPPACGRRYWTKRGALALVHSSSLAHEDRPPGRLRIS